MPGSENSMLKDPDIVNEYIRRSKYLMKLSAKEKRLIAAAFNAGYEYRRSVESE